MKFSDLEKMSPRSALEMLKQKMQEVRPVANEMALQVHEADMDLLMENVSLSFMAETFAMKFLQEEIDNTPVENDLSALSKLAKSVREEATWLFGACCMFQRQLFPDAYEVVDEVYVETPFSQQEFNIAEDICKAVADAELMDPVKERLFISICQEGKPNQMLEGRRILNPEEDGDAFRVFELLDILEDEMWENDNLRKGLYLVLSIGEKGEDERDFGQRSYTAIFEQDVMSMLEESCHECGNCDGEECYRLNGIDSCHWKRDNVLFMNELEPEDVDDAKAMLCILRSVSRITDGDNLLVGYTDAFHSTGNRTVISFCGRSGNMIVILR